MPEATAKPDVVLWDEVTPRKEPPDGYNTLLVTRVPTDPRATRKPTQEFIYRWLAAEGSGGRWKPVIAGVPPIPEKGINTEDVCCRGELHEYTVTAMRLSRRSYP